MNAGDLARLLLRLTTGGLMLFHGIGKLRNGIGKIAESVVAHGLPHFVAYGVYIGEVVAPLLVVLGLWTRPAAAAIAINLMFAVWLSHMGDLAHLGKGGGYALELQAFYAVSALCIVLLGAGAYSVSRGSGRLD